jgi:hypothetical protein
VFRNGLLDRRSRAALHRFISPEILNAKGLATMADPDPAPDKPNATPLGYSIQFRQKVVTAMQTIIITLFLAVAGYIINGKIDTNNAQLKENGDNQVKHSDESLKKQDVQIAKQDEVKAELQGVKEATKAIPQGIVEQKVIIEAKPAEAKSEPPGLIHDPH